jgi:hypothetical protein
MKTPASAHLLPEIALPYAYNELSPYCQGVVCEGRGFDFSIDVLIRTPKDRDGEYLGLVLASDTECAARTVLAIARNLHPFNQLVNQPTAEVAVTTEDLDALAAVLTQDTTFSSTQEGKKTIAVVELRADRLRAHAPSVKSTLRLTWQPTQYRVTRDNLPAFLPKTS